jgi:hypothetical protein
MPSNLTGCLPLPNTPWSSALQPVAINRACAASIIRTTCFRNSAVKRGEQLVDLLMIDVGVKLDHLFPRHAHGPISKSCSDAPVMPAGAKGIHGLLGFSHRPKFRVGELLMAGKLVLRGLCARHKIQPFRLMPTTAGLAGCLGNSMTEGSSARGGNIGRSMVMMVLTGLAFDSRAP